MLPDRVRVVVKERGSLFFPYRRKLTTIRLHLANWTRLPDNVWQNKSQQAVLMDVPKLLRRAQWQRLALQLYCLRGCAVEHKAQGCF